MLQTKIDWLLEAGYTLEGNVFIFRYEKGDFAALSETGLSVVENRELDDIKADHQRFMDRLGLPRTSK